jgi:hypothetical protein
MGPPLARRLKFRDSLAAQNLASRSPANLPIVKAGYGQSIFFH